MNSTAPAYIAAALVMSFMPGCAFLSAPDTPRMVDLHIDGAGAVIAQAPATGKSVMVGNPRAHPGYGGSRFAYIEDDHQLSYYGRHAWADEPGRMIRAAVVRALEQGGGFTAVVAAPSPANADLRLDLELVALHQDYRAGRQSELVLAMRVQLIETGTRRVVASRRFEQREPAGRGPVAGAAAADAALAGFLENLVAFVADASKRL